MRRSTLPAFIRRRRWRRRAWETRQKMRIQSIRRKRSAASAAEFLNSWNAPQHFEVMEHFFTFTSVYPKTVVALPLEPFHILQRLRNERPARKFAFTGKLTKMFGGRKFLLFAHQTLQSNVKCQCQIRNSFNVSMQITMYFKCDAIILRGVMNQWPFEIHNCKIYFLKFSDEFITFPLRE